MDDLLDLADDELHARLTQRGVDPDVATLLVRAARSGDSDSISTLREVAQ